MPPHRFHAQAAAGDDRGLTDALAADRSRRRSRGRLRRRSPAAPMRSLSTASAAPALPDLGARRRSMCASAARRSAGAWSEFEAASALSPRGVALSGACGGADVQRLGARLAVQEARAGLPDGAIRILAFATEIAVGDFRARQLPRRLRAAGRARLERCPARCGAARLAGPRPPRAGPFRLARDLTLLARARRECAGDRRGFSLRRRSRGIARRSACGARADGFDGKAAISPRQVAIINAVFAGRD